MGRVYTVQFNAIAVTAQQDFFELVAPADSVLRLMEFHLSQAFEIGDAMEEMLHVLLKRGQTTSGSGGTAPTPAPMNFGDAASGATSEVNNTTKASAGTIVTLGAWYWNLRVPLDQVWLPEACPILSPSQRGTIELATTPADSVTCSGWLAFEELGG